MLKHDVIKSKNGRGIWFHIPGVINSDFIIDNQSPNSWHFCPILPQFFLHSIHLYVVLICVKHYSPVTQFYFTNDHGVDCEHLTQEKRPRVFHPPGPQNTFHPIIYLPITFQYCILGRKSSENKMQKAFLV